MNTSSFEGQYPSTVSYIEHMLTELRNLSARESHDVLTYLIEMALIEATDLSHGIRVPQNKQAPDSVKRHFAG